MSPVALKENPLSIKLSGPKQFKTWFIRLKQHLIRHSTEWSEYASTGNISSVIEEYKMSKQASNTAIQLLSSALIDLIKLSTEGEANNLVYNISDTNELQSGKDLLDTIINTYQMSNVRYNSDIWTPLLGNANKPLEDKIKYANDLASKIFEPNEFDKEFMNNCSPAILLKYKENINSKKNYFIGYFLLALCPDSQKHCLSFMGNLTKMNHVELISRLKEADDNTTKVSTALVATKKRPTTKKTQKKKCGICGGPFHYFKDCEMLKKAVPTAPILDKNDTDAWTARNSDVSDTDLFFYGSEEDHNNFSKTDWIVDSGCTTHVTCDKNLLTSFVPSDGTCIKGVGGEIPIHGHGTAKIGSIQLENVAYAPQMPFNLLSTKKACTKANVSFILDNDSVSVLTSTGKILPLATVKNGLYVVDFKPKSTYAEKAFSGHEVHINSSLTKAKDRLLFSKQDSTPIEAIIHARLGHPGIDQYNRIAPIISAPKLKVSNVTLCPTCSLSKGIIKKGTTSQTEYTSPLQLIQVDLCGGFRYKNFNSDKYFMTIRDAYSRYYSVIHLKNKSEAVDKLMDWITAQENYFASRGGYTVGSIRTDNGGEFVNHQLHSFMTKKGIQHQLTVPHSSFQNGAVERAHRTIEEKTRCLLVGGRIPTSLWPEAVSCAVYLINRLPITNKNGAIPYCLWHDISPERFNVKHLRVFGCAAYATLATSLRDGKLSPTSIAGIHVGYDTDHKGYRIYHPPSRKIFVSTQVKFDESHFPLADSQQTIDSHSFATSVLGGAPSYPSVGITMTAPSKPITRNDSAQSNPSELPSDSDISISSESMSESDTPISSNQPTSTPASQHECISESHDLVLADPVVDNLTTDLSETQQQLEAFKQSAAQYASHNKQLTDQLHHAVNIIPSPTSHLKRPNSNVETLPPIYAKQTLPQSHASKKRNAQLTGTSTTLAIPTSLNTADNHQFSAIPSERPGSTDLQRIPVDQIYSDRVRHFLSKHDWSPTGHSLHSLPVTVADPLFNSNHSIVMRDSSNPLSQQILTPTGDTDPSTSISSPDLTTTQLALTAMVRGHSMVNGSLTIPFNIKAALTGKNSTAWLAACKKELKAFKDHDTYDLVPLPPGAKSLGTRWVLTVKGNSTAKARLVAQGHRQIAGLDYTETFAPVVRYDSVRIFLALSACLHLHVHQMDVNTAFLNSSMDDIVYVRQPPSFINKEHPDWVWKLSGAMYGLKQAPLLWNKHINGTLTKLGFNQHAGEHGLYFKHSPSGLIFVALYVDDLLIAAPDMAIMQKVKNALSRFYSMKDLMSVNKFLGMNVNQTSNDITLSLEDYISQAAVSNAIPLDKPVDIPLSPTTNLFDDQSLPLDNVTPYQSIVGQLLFIANTGRPDVAHSVSLLSRFLKAPTEIHLTAARRVFQYLYTTRKAALVYRIGSPIHMNIYSDASYGTTTDIPYATRGYITQLAGGIITWCSKKIRSTVTLSSTEAEYISASEAVAEMQWLRNLMQHMEIKIKTPTLWVDNLPAIHIAENPVHHSRMKHVAIKHHHIRKTINDGEIEIQHVGTENQLADITTKTLARKPFTYLTNKLFH